MLDHLGLSLRDGGVEEGQMHRDIRVDVGHIHKHILNRQPHRQLLPAFPDQGLLLRFSRFYLAACKLP